MALAPINPTQITPPRVNLIDERSGAISREWYRFFLSLRNATQENQEETMLAPDSDSLLATYDAMLAELTQTTETLPEGASASDLAVVQGDIQALALAPPSNGGTVTSVDASGGTTGLTFSGGPITTSGTLTLGGTLAIANGGTGATTAAVARTNLGASTLGSNVFTITNPSAVTFPRFNADNTVSALDAASFRTAIGAGTGGGSVTSVAMSVPAFLTVTGSPITTSGTLAVTLSGTALPIANGGTGATTAAVARTNLGATTVGSNLFTLTNPSAVTFPRFNADNTVSALDAATFRTAIGAGTSSTTGTVTSASVVSANGFAGTVATATTTPAITLTTTVTGVLKGNGTAISAATINVDYLAPSAPVTKTANFTVAVSETWIINNKSGSTCTVTLPSAATYPGRYLSFQNNQDQNLVSASSNVVPQGGGAAGTSILINVSGNWATLVSNGTNWVIMQAASFNNLLF